MIVESWWFRIAVVAVTLGMAFVIYAMWDCQRMFGGRFLGYDAEQVSGLLKQLSASQKHNFLDVQQYWDSWLPALLALSTIGWNIILSHHMREPGDSLQLVVASFFVLLSLTGAVADYTENTLLREIVSADLAGQGITAQQVRWASTMTVIKLWTDTAAAGFCLWQIKRALMG